MKGHGEAVKKTSRERTSRPHRYERAARRERPTTTHTPRAHENNKLNRSETGWFGATRLEKGTPPGLKTPTRGTRGAGREST